MPADALALALGAACLHALWNLLLARASDVQAATAVTFVVAVVAFLPVAVARWDVEAAAIPYVAVSSGFELAYLVLLAAAYTYAQLSVVYPIARGLAPVLVLGIGVTVLGVGTSAVEVWGVLLVALGVLLVRGLRAGDSRGAAFGVAIAACIAGYTLADARGVDHADPLAYLELVMAGPVVVYAAVMARRRGLPALRRQLGPSTVIAGLSTFGAFGLALFALQRASAASVAAVRETSVVIAVALAAPVLGERVTPKRFAGAVLVVAGVAILGLG
ncbi:MAG TPA: DMT family transporter [Gaiellaceae bacterium]|jgi:drug/metabolite transporter (DMT)-like permease|nr:DMT family transporter [Gaiellaceae bacterium]